MAVTVNWPEYDAVLFDLDGVITPTAVVHMRDFGLPGFTSARCPPRRTLEPVAGAMPSTRPSSSRKAAGWWVCPNRQYGVSKAARLARATPVDVMYSQVGSRGLP